MQQKLGRVFWIYERTSRVRTPKYCLQKRAALYIFETEVYFWLADKRQRERTMRENQEELVQRLRQTVRCQPDVRQIAAEMADFPVEEYEALLRLLLERGEDKGVGILLCASAVNGVKLDPTLLAESLKGVDNIGDVSFAYKWQDAAGIAPLLEIAQAEDISWERQALAARLAAELAIRFDGDRRSVKKVLWRLDNEIGGFEAAELNRESLALINAKEPDKVIRRWLSELQPMEELPTDRPPVVIGGDYSVRRPVPKIGRNEQCHCGSGKKYKKCCYEKDQELLSDASPYEGITMTQVRSSPALVEDARPIHDMRPYELKKLSPVELNSGQLLAAYQQTELYGLRELALSMLLEWEKRSEEKELVVDHLQDLLYSALRARDLKVAHEVLRYLPESLLDKDQATKFHLKVLQEPEWLAALEERCKQAILKPNDPDELNYPMLELSSIFEKCYPALSIVFGRAAIISRQDSYLDNEYLLDVIQKARIALDLEPWDDPVEAYFDWIMEEDEFTGKERADDGEVLQLKQQVREALERAEHASRELRQKEAELNATIRKFEKAEAKQDTTQPQPLDEAPAMPKEVVETIDRLRQRVKNLKGEIKSQQEVRAQLRRQLQEAQKKAVAAEVSPKTKEISREAEDGQEFAAAAREILIPEYSDAFRHSCETLPTPIVGKALRAAAAFASHEKSVWRQTKRLETLPDCYRIRIGLHHRLLLRWVQGKRLQILDLISRQNLETWIKQYAA